MGKKQVKNNTAPFFRRNQRQKKELEKNMNDFFQQRQQETCWLDQKRKLSCDPLGDVLKLMSNTPN